jgi:hypothetical protein
VSALSHRERSKPTPRLLQVVLTFQSVTKIPAAVVAYYLINKKER